jgi:gliding motility-associated lipoprotein GldH
MVYRRFIPCFLLVLIAMFLTACQDKSLVYQDHHLIPNSQWNEDSAMVFKFNIDDEKSSYNIYYFVRSNLAYPFANLYLRDEIFEAGNAKSNTGLKQFFLSDPETGQPRGSGLADVRDYTLLAYQGVQFKKKGIYTLRLKHYMRQEILQGISCVGIIVEQGK